MKYLLSLTAMLILANTLNAKQAPPNVLFVISDDLTSTALSCYGNTVCETPNIDRLAARGTRFTKAYAQGSYCGPSRASLMSGYYPHATGQLGYKSPRSQIGNRPMWPEHFKNNGYYTARVSKIFHMAVPGDIELGVDGSDDSKSWTEKFNCAGPEWTAVGFVRPHVPFVAPKKYFKAYKQYDKMILPEKISHHCLMIQLTRSAIPPFV